VQDGVQRGGQQRGEDGCGEEPDHDGVPLPGPEGLGCRPGVDVHQMNQVVGCEWGRASAEEDLAGAEVDQHERELDGEAEVVGDLRGDEVEAGEKRYAQGEECCGADDGIDADDGTDGEGPGESAGGGAHS